LRTKKNIAKLSESEVIALAQKDSYYFGSLYEKYFEQIFRFVFKRLGGKEAIAGDITQQTFIKAMANIENYEDRGFPFSSWLYRIAHNEVSMFFRSQKKTFAVSINENQLADMANEAEIDGYMSIEQQEKLMALMNDMEQDQLDLIELRFFQDFSFKQIADIYNITEANAKMKTYRLLKSLGKKWTNTK
tara:strand:+ start:442 stop:1008 length:567 start_codon:yes stop_codon:yes gene_type:complete